MCLNKGPICVSLKIKTHKTHEIRLEYVFHSLCVSMNIHADKLCVSHYI